METLITEPPNRLRRSTGRGQAPGGLSAQSQRPPWKWEDTFKLPPSPAPSVYTHRTGLGQNCPAEPSHPQDLGSCGRQWLGHLPPRTGWFVTHSRWLTLGEQIPEGLVGLFWKDHSGSRRRMGSVQRRTGTQLGRYRKDDGASPRAGQGTQILRGDRQVPRGRRGRPVLSSVAGGGRQGGLPVSWLGLGEGEDFH